MEKEFNERHSIIKFIRRRCPACGTQCYINHFQDIVCPNCGIVDGILESSVRTKLSYIG